MKNTGQIVRSKKTGKSRYTPISNEILQSQTLTPEQKSILVHLLSLPEDWVVYKTEIWKSMNIGRDRFHKSWKGLVELGYIHSIKVIDTNTNLIRGYNHIVYEEPLLMGLPNIGLTENQVDRDSGCIQSNNEQSNNIQSNNIKNNNIRTNTNSDFDMFSVFAQKLAEIELNKLINK